MFENLKQKQEQKRLEDERRLEEEKKRREEEHRILADLAYAQEELNQLKKEHGMEEEEKGLKKLISTLLDNREARIKVPVRKKKYLWLGLLLGIFGGHRFYAKQYITAVLYLLLCWTGISITMTIIDLMIVLPMEADENGNVLL